MKIKLLIISILFLCCSFSYATSEGLTTGASVYGPAGKLTEMNGPIKHKLWFYFGIKDVKQTHLRISAKSAGNSFCFPLIAQILADIKTKSCSKNSSF
jgi:hypothetical protein